MFDIAAHFESMRNLRTLATSFGLHYQPKLKATLEKRHDETIESKQQEHAASSSSLLSSAAAPLSNPLSSNGDNEGNSQHSVAELLARI